LASESAVHRISEPVLSSKYLCFACERQRSPTYFRSRSICTTNSCLSSPVRTDVFVPIDKHLRSRCSSWCFWFQHKEILACFRPPRLRVFSLLALLYLHNNKYFHSLHLHFFSKRSTTRPSPPQYVPLPSGSGIPSLPSSHLSESYCTIYCILLYLPQGHVPATIYLHPATRLQRTHLLQRCFESGPATRNYCTMSNKNLRSRPCGC
ncbi:unnamed protein product, partial [Ectocarpus sp. 12 AP-2014]